MNLKLSLTLEFDDLTEPPDWLPSGRVAPLTFRLKPQLARAVLPLLRLSLADDEAEEA